jgi:hypothetical protein
VRRHLLGPPAEAAVLPAILAATVLGACAAVLGAGAAAGATRTQASVYTPFTSSGAPTIRVVSRIRGYCWTGSLAVDHRDAWRCMSGNLIYDPCFSSPTAKGVVLCPASGPWSRTAIEITLTRKLPTKYGNRRAPSTSGLPWALVTASGWRCELNTGATTVVSGRRANYACTGTQDWLWGAPLRKSQPWKIYAARSSAKRLKRKVAIKAAWF